MNKCKYCNQEIDEDTTFCSYCNREQRAGRKQNKKVLLFVNKIINM